MRFFNDDFYAAVYGQPIELINLLRAAYQCIYYNFLINDILQIYLKVTIQVWIYNVQVLRSPLL